MPPSRNQGPTEENWDEIACEQPLQPRRLRPLRPPRSANRPPHHLASEKGSKLIKGFELTIASVEILTTAGETFCTALTTGVIRGFSARDCRGKKQHMRKAKAYSKNKGGLRLFHLTVSLD